MKKDTKTKKIRLSGNFSQPVEHDEEQINEILTSNYRRFSIKEKIRETTNEELTMILKENKVIAMYELKCPLKRSYVYALVCKGTQIPYELKDIQSGTKVGIYGSFKEVCTKQERFLYILVNNKSEKNLMYQ